MFPHPVHISGNHWGFLPVRLSDWCYGYVPYIIDGLGRCVRDLDIDEGGGTSSIIAGLGGG